MKKSEIHFAFTTCKNNLTFSAAEGIDKFIKNSFKDSLIAKEIKLKRRRIQKVIVCLADVDKKEIIKDFNENGFILHIDGTRS